MPGATVLIQKIFQEEAKGKKGEPAFHGAKKARLIEMRRQEHAVERVERPLNPVRARKLGYKAKEGFIVARVRVRAGSGTKPKPRGGRKHKRMGTLKLTRKISIRGIAEQRASRKFPNCEVLNSYLAGKDGKRHFYDVILVARDHPAVKKDKERNWITKKKHKGRASRGLTSAGTKSRGQRRKGKGAEKARPSLRANKRRGN